MKDLTIVIPTRNRIDSLRRTLDTIPHVPFIDTVVICDGDLETERLLVKDGYPNTTVIGLEVHCGSVFCRNWVLERPHLVPDGFLNAVDDITFYANTIYHVFDKFNETFDDDDGVVGICQDQPDFHPSGMFLMGRRFIERYPNRHVFFPEYYHFAAQEIYWLSTRLGKFVQDKEAIVHHFHPSLDSATAVDETHREARVKSAEDHALMRGREKTDDVWGELCVAR